MSYEGDDVMSDGRLFQITGAQRLKTREPMTVGREVTDGVASLLNAADLSVNIYMQEVRSVFLNFCSALENSQN